MLLGFKVQGYFSFFILHSAFSILHSAFCFLPSSLLILTSAFRPATKRRDVPLLRIPHNKRDSGEAIPLGKERNKKRTFCPATKRRDAKNAHSSFFILLHRLRFVHDNAFLATANGNKLSHDADADLLQSCRTDFDSQRRVDTA